MDTSETLLESLRSRPCPCSNLLVHARIAVLAVFSDRLDTTMNTSNTTCQIFIAFSRYYKASVFDHVSKLLLRWKLLDALDEILVAVSVPCDQLTDQRYRTEAPSFVKCIEQTVVDMAEFKASEKTARLEHSICVADCRSLVREIADTK
jgi:hypothetical protein